MRASEIMTRPVVTVRPETPLTEAVRLMLDHRISGLPVVNSRGAPVGMLTEGDLLRRAETGTAVKRPRWLEFLAGPGPLADDYVRSHGRSVHDVMTRTVVSATEGALLDDIVQLMQSRHIKRLPIVRDGCVVGVVSRADLIRALAQRLRTPIERPQDDDEIAKRVGAAMAQAPWTSARTVKTRVKDGVVCLEGTIFDDRERQAFNVLVENVTGVRGVEDRIVWIEPVTGMVVPGV